MKWNRGRMNHACIQHLRNELEASREEALRVLNGTRDERHTLDSGYPQDIGDLSVTNSSWDLLFERSRQERQLLQMIETALRRIYDRTFGECIACGGRINLKRLEAVPWTQYCLQCQDKLEHAESGESSKIDALQRPLGLMHLTKRSANYVTRILRNVVIIVCATALLLGTQTANARPSDSRHLVTKAPKAEINECSFCDTQDAIAPTKGPALAVPVVIGRASLTYELPYQIRPRESSHHNRAPPVI